MQCSRTLFSHSRSLTCSQQTEPPPHFVLSLSLSLDGYILEGKEKESIQKRIQQHREKKLQRANAAGSISISLCRCCHRRFQHRKVPSPSQSAKSVPKEASLNYSNAPFHFFFFFSLTYFYLFLIRPTPTQQTHRHFLSLSQPTKTTTNKIFPPYEASLVVVPLTLRAKLSLSLFLTSLFWANLPATPDPSNTSKYYFSRSSSSSS